MFARIGKALLDRCPTREQSNLAGIGCMFVLVAVITATAGILIVRYVLVHGCG